MKRLFFIMFIICLFSGCTVTRQKESVVGVYSVTKLSLHDVPIGEETLSLRQDGIFEYKWRSFDHRMTDRYYQGKWEKVNSSIISLDFDELITLEQIGDALSGPYNISCQDRDAEIISKNKIQLDGIAFKRIRKRP